jgi:hypothetical protein
MCRRRCVSAAAIVAAASLICCVGVRSGPARAGDDGAKLLFFSGTDLWRDGQFLYGGVLWSPGGLDRDGFTVKAVLSGGRYRYVSGALGNVAVTGSEEEAQILPGWRFTRGTLELKVYAGIDIKNDTTSPTDPGNRLHGISVGARAAVDLWYEPTPTTMLAANASLTSIDADYSARLAVGWRLLGFAYIGPEAQTFACANYSQWRLGLHITGLKTGAWEWSAAGGWSSDSDSRSGGYVRLGLLTRR